MKQKILALLSVVALMLTACHQTTGNNGGGEAYPMPSAEEEAMAWLYDTLMSDAGRAMTGEQLAQLKKDRSINDVSLPVNDEDVLPRMGTYKNDPTGGTIVFKPYTNEKDTINPICQADFRVPFHSWEEKVYLPDDSCYTECIQNRGKGIMAIYRIVHQGGPNGGRHRCYAKHPDGYPEYWGVLLYVYPGADSLLFTCGYEKSKRVYHFVKE